MTHSLLLLAGDGIGPEIFAQLKRVIEWFNQHENTQFSIIEGLVGGCSIDAHGVPLTHEVLAQAKAVDAVLLGAVGGPQWEGLSFDIRPEQGLLSLRKELCLFANLRPAIVLPGMEDASSLKKSVVEGLDIMIVRELTGGVYFGEPRGITVLENGERVGVNTHIYSSSEIKRVARMAFEMARKRGNHVCSVEKGNVMEAGRLWREEVIALHAQEFSDVTLTHMLADNCAMQLLRNPKQFDVIVTDNLFGDILSDEAAMLTGSLGMLPSASIGAAINGKIPALYEPVHGSAPDIAGKNLANPIATLLSFAMALRYSFNRHDLGEKLEKAVAATLNNNIRTADIAEKTSTKVGTVEMGTHIIAALG